MMIRETKKRMFAAGHRIKSARGFWIVKVTVDDGLMGKFWVATIEKLDKAKEHLSNLLYLGAKWQNFVKTSTRAQILEARRVQKS